MKRTELPMIIKSPLSGDELELKDSSYHNDTSLSAAQFMDSCTEWVEDIVMYKNEKTNEVLYLPIDI